MFYKYFHTQPFIRDFTTNLQLFLPLMFYQIPLAKVKDYIQIHVSIMFRHYYPKITQSVSIYGAAEGVKKIFRGKCKVILSSLLDNISQEYFGNNIFTEYIPSLESPILSATFCAQLIYIFLYRLNCTSIVRQPKCIVEQQVCGFATEKLKFFT